MKETYTHESLYPNEHVAKAVADYSFEHSTKLPKHITDHHAWGSNHERSNYVIWPLQAQMHLWLAKAVGAKRSMSLLLPPLLVMVLSFLSYISHLKFHSMIYMHSVLLFETQSALLSTPLPLFCSFNSLPPSRGGSRTSSFFMRSSLFSYQVRTQTEQWKSSKSEPSSVSPRWDGPKQLVQVGT